MKPIFRFFTQTSSVVLIGVIVSVLLVILMSAINQFLAATKPPETGIAVFLDSTTVKDAPVPIIPDNEKSDEKVPVNLEANLEKKGILINTAPPKNQDTKAATKLVKVNDLGKYIKELRAQKVIKIADLKAATGLTEQQILNIENGKIVPTPETALDFETVLKIDIEYNK